MKVILWGAALSALLVWLYRGMKPQTRSHTPASKTPRYDLEVQLVLKPDPLRLDLCVTNLGNEPVPAAPVAMSLSYPNMMDGPPARGGSAVAALPFSGTPTLPEIPPEGQATVQILPASPGTRCQVPPRRRHQSEETLRILGDIADQANAGLGDVTAFQAFLAAHRDTLNLEIGREHGGFVQWNGT